MSAFEPLGLATRVVLFAAVLTVVGAAAFRWLVLCRRDANPHPELEGALSRRAATLGLLAAIVVLVAAAARLAIQLRDLADPDLALGPQVGALLLRTMWGRAFIGQVAAALLALAGFALARRAVGAGWLVAAAAGVLLAASPAFSGHAIGSQTLAPLAVTADVIHVLAAGTWLGGATVVAALVRLPRSFAAPERAGPLVARFTPVALVAAGLTAVTGVTGGWLHAGPPTELLAHSYGRALLAKVATVAMVAAVGAFNWRRAGPRLLREHDETAMSRSVGAELLGAVLVLLATAILVVTPPYGDE